MSELSRASPSVGIGEIVDLDVYPIHLLPSGERRAVAMVDRHRGEMATAGVSVLPGFVSPAAMDQVVAEAVGLAPRGHFSETFSTPYLSAPDATMSGNDPRSRSQRAALSAVAFDEFGPRSLLVRLYESAELRGFLAAVLDIGELYSYADPLGAMSIAAMGAGDELGWHFDFSEFVVSLGIRSSQAGGTFDVVPGLRSDSDPNERGVIEVLDGEERDVVTLPLEPGALMIFAGRNSLHRVSPIVGEVARLVALLSYDARPGVDSTDELKRIRYGRTTPHHVGGGTR